MVTVLRARLIFFLYCLFLRCCLEVLFKTRVGSFNARGTTMLSDEEQCSTMLPGATELKMICFSYNNPRFFVPYNLSCSLFFCPADYNKWWFFFFFPQETFMDYCGTTFYSYLFPQSR
ncbi:unnamed protein product [Amoebophrya sp. A25]|nr:unnamed protein product [Amoebophrya sp. A25]|eukprot:GSA25T00006903001.1